MAALTPNGGSPSITSTTYEGALFQLIEFIQLAENNTDINGTGANRITGTINGDTMMFKGRIDITAGVDKDVNGDLKFFPSDYLEIPSWNPGDGTGTLKQPTWTGQLLELINELVKRQENETINPDRVRYIDVPEYNFRTGKITAEYNIPVQKTMTDSGAEYAAKNILGA